VRTWKNTWYRLTAGTRYLSDDINASQCKCIYILNIQYISPSLLQLKVRTEKYIEYWKCHVTGCWNIILYLHPPNSQYLS
jgi:hypothetical protein